MNRPTQSPPNDPSSGIEHKDLSAQVVTLREPSPVEATGPRLLDGNLGLISGVKVRVEVVVGSAELSISELFTLQQGSIVPLEQLHNAPLSIRLDGKVIGHGSLVVVGDNFAVRISDIASTT